MRGILIKLQDAEACFYFAPLDEMWPQGVKLAPRCELCPLAIKLFLRGINPLFAPQFFYL
jgi:hypothetical protein